MSLEQLRDIPLATEQLDSLCDVLRERQRQDDKWGEQNHEPLYWLGIISEETGEWSKALIEHRQPREVRAELVQLVASALAALECHDRLQRRQDAAHAEFMRALHWTSPSAKGLR